MSSTCSLSVQKFGSMCLDEIIGSHKGCVYNFATSLEKFIFIRDNLSISISKNNVFLLKGNNMSVLVILHTKVNLSGPHDSIVIS